MKRLRWLLPLSLAGVALFVGSAAGRPLALWWLGSVWPQLFSLWQSVQLFLPFPTSAVLLPLVLLAFLAPLVVWFRRPRASGALLNLATVTAVLLLWLQLLWGVNYQREPAWRQLQLDGPVSEAQQLELAAYLLAVITEEQHAAADVARAVRSGSAELDRLLAGLGHPGPLRVGVTGLPAGWLLSFSVSGMIFPLSLEPLTDSGLPDWQQVSVGVHELSHVAGVAGEDDATLLAALAGLRAEDGYARYASALDAFSRLRLPVSLQQELLVQLPPRALHDLEAARAALARHRISWLADVQAGLFDWWLKLQGSEAGLADYSLGASRLPLALEAGLLP